MGKAGNDAATVPTCLYQAQATTFVGHLLEIDHNSALPLQMEDGGVDERFLGHQASQRFGADLLNQQRGKVRSGDDDLSGKLPLSQRRAKLDGAKSRQATRWDC